MRCNIWTIDWWRLRLLNTQWNHEEDLGCSRAWVGLDLCSVNSITMLEPRYSHYAGNLYHTQVSYSMRPHGLSLSVSQAVIIRASPYIFSCYYSIKCWLLSLQLLSHAHAIQQCYEYIYMYIHIYIYIYIGRGVGLLVGEGKKNWLLGRYWTQEL